MYLGYLFSSQLICDVKLSHKGSYWATPCINLF